MATAAERGRAFRERQLLNLVDDVASLLEYASDRAVRTALAGLGPSALATLRDALSEASRGLRSPNHERAG